MRVHIVTDSSAQFAHPQVVLQYPVTIVPNKIEVAGKTYHEGQDLSADKAIDLVQNQEIPPKLIAPTIDEYAEVYTRLAYHQDVLLSIHTSRELSDSYVNAKAAAKQLEGHVRVHVIDSRTLDAAQGMIVRAAARAVDVIDDEEDLIQAVRGAVERTYAIYFTETTHYLVHNNLMDASTAILNAMHNTMPILSLEDGHIVTTEKVRTRNQAIDRMLEFVVEFDTIDDALILQPRAFMNEHTRNLQDRLSQEFPERHFPHTIYSSSLATLIGADATGLVILEGDEENKDNT